MRPTEEAKRIALILSEDTHEVMQLIVSTLTHQGDPRPLFLGHFQEKARLRIEAKLVAAAPTELDAVARALATGGDAKDEIEGIWRRTNDARLDSHRRYQAAHDQLEAADGTLKIKSRELERHLAPRLRRQAREALWPVLGWGSASLVCYLAELVPAETAARAASGLAHYPAYSIAPGHVQSQYIQLLLGIGLAMMVATGALTHLTKELKAEWLSRASLVLAACMPIATFAFLLAIRAVDASMPFAGQVAVFGFMVLCTLAAAKATHSRFASAWAIWRERSAGASESSADLALRQTRIRDLERERDAALEQLEQLEGLKTSGGRLERDLERLGSLRDSLVQSTRQEVAEKTAAALAMRQVLRDASEVERDLMIMQVWRLEQTDGAPSGLSRAARTATMLASVGLAVFLTACGPTVEPTSDIIVCDVSGSIARCDAAVVETFVRDWARSNALVPGSSIELVRVGGTYSEARSVFRLTPPTQLQGDPLLAVDRWLGEQLHTIDLDKQLACDGSCKSALNSDVFGAIAHAAQLGGVGPGPVNLIVASDGRVISRELGVDLERREPPEVEEFLDRQTTAGPALNAFRSVRWCGLDNQDATYAEATARNHFLARVLEAWGAPELAILPHCPVRQ